MWRRAQLIVVSVGSYGEVVIFSLLGKHEDDHSHLRPVKHGTLEGLITQ